MNEKQMQEERGFVHEHPWSAFSWQLDCVTNLLGQPGVECRRGDQCHFRQSSLDTKGAGLVGKATGWISSVPDVFDRAAVRCSNTSKPK